MNDATVRRRVVWEYAADTNVGMVRTVNEDAILARPEIGVWAVADGMGGHAVGDVASKMVLEAIEEIGSQDNLTDLVNCVEDNLIKVNQKILKYSETELNNKTVGSTIVVLIISGRVGVCLWVGDSRLYRYRKGTLEQLSRDHSRVEELIQQGVLLPEEAENHPESNVITRAVGVDSDFCVDIAGFDTNIGDTFLLCSDGLYNMLNDQKLIEHLNQTSNQDKVDNLISGALERGATDNVSVIVVKGAFERNLNRETLNRSKQ
jgi:serine/threonine protein phosphatase PrpC